MQGPLAQETEVLGFYPDPSVVVNELNSDSVVVTSLFGEGKDGLAVEAGVRLQSGEEHALKAVGRKYSERGDAV